MNDIKNYEVASLNQRITIQKRTLLKDEACNEVEIYQNYYSCYASVLEAKTTVKVDNREQINNQAVTFFVRSCKKVEALINSTKDYQLIYKNMVFDILQADNYGYTHDKFKIIARCKEV